MHTEYSNLPTESSNKFSFSSGCPNRGRLFISRSDLRLDLKRTMSWRAPARVPSSHPSLPTTTADDFAQEEAPLSVSDQRTFYLVPALSFRFSSLFSVQLLWYFSLCYLSLNLFRCPPFAVCPSASFLVCIFFHLLIVFSLVLQPLGQHLYCGHSSIPQQILRHLRREARRCPQVEK